MHKTVPHKYNLKRLLPKLVVTKTKRMGLLATKTVKEKKPAAKIRNLKILVMTRTRKQNAKKMIKKALAVQEGKLLSTPFAKIKSYPLIRIAFLFIK